jgi:hypothetical protein
MWIVVAVVINSQGQIDHFLGLGNNLGLVAESSEEMADKSMKPFPVVGDEGFTLEADFINEPLTEPAPAQAGVASSWPPSTQAMVRRATGSYAR